MRRGFFITFEGPEGSGKSSQAKWLAQALRRRGHKVVFVRDPGSTVLGRRLRRVLLHTRRVRISPLAEALLFIAGRVQLVEELIKPALAKGRVVVCDRFHDSTVAYQGFGGGVDVRWLEAIGRRAVGGLMPDLTILLDVPTAVGFARLRHRRDRMERKRRAFHQRVHRGFLTLARREPRRVVVFDATRPKPELHQRILTRCLAAGGAGAQRAVTCGSGTPFGDPRTFGFAKRSRGGARLGRRTRCPSSSVTGRYGLV